MPFETSSFGTVMVPWEEVAIIQSDGPLNVVVPDGRTVQATLQSSGGKIELKETRQAMNPANLLTIRNADEQVAYERMLNPAWSRLWTGTATIGFAGTKANAQPSTFTVGLNAVRATNADETRLHFHAVKASAMLERVYASTAQAVRGGWAYNRIFSSRLFANTFHDYA